MPGTNSTSRNGVRLRMELIGSIRRLHAFYAANPSFPNYDSSFFNRFEARVAADNLDRVNPRG